MINGVSVLTTSGYPTLFLVTRVRRVVAARIEDFILHFMLQVYADENFTRAQGTFALKRAGSGGVSDASCQAASG
jgi:hypothetical protein